MSLLFYSLETTRHLGIHTSLNSFGSLNTWASNSFWLCKMKVLKLVQTFKKINKKCSLGLLTSEETGSDRGGVGSGAWEGLHVHPQARTLPQPSAASGPTGWARPHGLAPRSPRHELRLSARSRELSSLQWVRTHRGPRGLSAAREMCPGAGGSGRRAGGGGGMSSSKTRTQGPTASAFSTRRG